MLACHCLNVIIETEENDFKKVTAVSLNLPLDAAQDDFFRQDVQQVGKLININKIYSGLIQTRNVDFWTVHYCINCDVHTHAIHREKGASCVLTNAKLLSKAGIEKLRTSENYSKLYKIIIKTDQLIEDELANIYFPDEVENVLKTFKSIAAELLRSEAQAAEQKIKDFTDQQYKQLSDLREATFREQQAITKILLENLTSTTQISTNTSPNPQGLPSRMNEPLSAGRDTNTSPHKQSQVVRHTPKRQKSLPYASVASFDAERLFEFDGIDDAQSGEDSEALESDLEEMQEGRAGARQRRGGAHAPSAMARSLPMSIPIFMPGAMRKQRELDEDEEGVLGARQADNLDIAASIKALAKSVHGDTVFGDLPKPRCPSYI